MAGGGEFAAVDWGILPLDHIPADMAELVDGWIAHHTPADVLPAGRPISVDTRYVWAWEAVYRLTREYPVKAMAFILAVLVRSPGDEIRYSLAAGPLEDVLVYHGVAVIDEVERLSRQDAVFRDTLRGVWRNAISDEIWRRVVASRGTDASP